MNNNHQNNNNGFSSQVKGGYDVNPQVNKTQCAKADMLQKAGQFVKNQPVKATAYAIGTAVGITLITISVRNFRNNRLKFGNWTWTGSKKAQQAPAEPAAPAATEEGK